MRGPRIIFLGKQGSGKGTQCGLLAHHYVIPHISTGDIFRSVLRSKSELGDRLRSILAAGDLVSDAVTLDVVRERLERDRVVETGFLLDGFPRTIAQVEGLEVILGGASAIDLAVNLDLPTEAAVERLSQRRVCVECQAVYGDGSRPAVPGVCDRCGGEVIQREDDAEDAIRRRLALYEEQTRPILGWFEERGLLVTIDALGSVDEVSRRIIEKIDAVRLKF